MRDRLARLLDRPRAGLVTDLDGTIAGIAPRPQVSPAIRAALAALAGRMLVAVITGRRAGDAQALIDIPGIEIVGNHGLERWRAGAVEIVPEALAHRPAIEALLAELHAIADPYGCIVQDKQVSVVVDHRGSRPGIVEELCACVLDACGRGGFRALRSRASIEILPPIGVDKGSALRGLVDERALGGVVYLGDDTSDIDALREVGALRRRGIDAIGVGVIHEESTGAIAEHADLVVDGVHGVEQLLRELT